MQFVIHNAVPDAYAFKWVLGLVVFLALDSLWFSCMYGLLYREGTTDKRNTAIMGICMVLYAITASAILATFVTSSSSEALATGSVLGILVFGTFNITTIAINSKWPLSTAIVDTLYGTSAWVAVALVQYSGA